MLERPGDSPFGSYARYTVQREQHISRWCLSARPIHQSSPVNLGKKESLMKHGHQMNNATGNPIFPMEMVRILKSMQIFCRSAIPQIYRRLLERQNISFP